MLLRAFLDMFNLGQFDPINQVIPLTMIPLSVAHCVVLKVLIVITENDYMIKLLNTEAAPHST
jgi:hypothetical protein